MDSETPSNAETRKHVYTRWINAEPSPIEVVSYNREVHAYGARPHSVQVELCASALRTTLTARTARDLARALLAAADVIDGAVDESERERRNRV